MCRNDKKLLKYELRLDLYDTVSEVPEDSHMDRSSVGRVFVTLTKVTSPSRWKRLLADNSVKPTNMQIWWDIYEKHEKDLDNFKLADDEDDAETMSELEESVVGAGDEEGGTDEELADKSTPGPKKKKGKRGKNKKESNKTLLNIS